jgi:hypothetical protein
VWPSERPADLARCRRAVAETFDVESTASNDVAGTESPAVTLEPFEPAADTAFATGDSFGFAPPAEVATESFESTADTFDA